MTKHKIVAGINCMGIAAVLVALIAKIQTAHIHKQQATTEQHTTQETQMKEHTELLQQYRQRIEGLFADVEGILRQLEQNSGTMDSQDANGWTVTETIARQMAAIQMNFAVIGADVATAVITEANRARQSVEHSDSE